MAGIKISNLTASNNILESTDLLPISRSGGTYNITGDAFISNLTGIVKAWVVFDGTKNSSGVNNLTNTDRYIKSQYNISNVTRFGAGKYTLTFTKNFSNTNYLVTGLNSANLGGVNMGIYASSFSGQPTLMTTNQVQIVFGEGTTGCDVGYGSVLILSL
jgi:hypothetical protein